MLQLSFAFVRINDPDGGPSIEMARVDEQIEGMTQPQDIGDALNSSLGQSALEWPPSARLSIGDTVLRVACAHLGFYGEIGVIVAGARAPDFPNQMERLLVDVATNQAAVGLQQAHVLSEQRRVALELDRRVAQRTRELAAANEELRRSERESRLMVDSIPGLVTLLTAEGDIAVVNRRVFEYFGQTLEELRHWATNDTVHPEDRPHVVDTFTRSVASGSPYEIVQRFRRFDGVYRWFRNSGCPLRDTDGRVVRWCVLLTDIDDRKRAEDAIRASERNLQLIIDTIPALAWSARPDGSTEFFNRHYLEYLGLSAGEARGWGWTASVHGDDLDELSAEWQSMVASDHPGETEVRLRRSDGEYRWFLFRANPLRDESGKTIKWYGTNTDIDDRKCAEEELRRSETFLAEGQNLARLGSFSWRVEDDRITWSDQLYRIFDFAPGSLVTLDRLRERVHPDDIPLLNDMIKRARSHASNFEYEHRLLMPDKSVKHLHLIAHATRDENGRPEYLGAVQDVTERRLSEEALGQARSELARVAGFTSLGALTASIAHEVNQPLSGIVTNASTCLRMLGTEPPNLDGARETARRTIRDGNRAAEVISRLRALFSGRGSTTESVDLNDATREVIALSLTELQRSKVTLRTELGEGLPPLSGDRVQLQQVILNLVRNAMDAMSSIADRPRHLLIRTELDREDRIRLTVRDSGVGFAPETADRLFEAFYTTKSDGMGIGLSVSRSIIENHRGRLWAVPNDGPGVSFSFSVPRRTQGATSTA
jgi:PAS domain S-box-containing protein